MVCEIFVTFVRQNILSDEILSEFELMYSTSILVFINYFIKKTRRANIFVGQIFVGQVFGGTKFSSPTHISSLLFNPVLLDKVFWQFWQFWHLFFKWTHSSLNNRKDTTMCQKHSGGPRKATELFVLFRVRPVQFWRWFLKVTYSSLN